MPTRDEKTFTDDEWIAAFSLILPPEQARAEGLAWNAMPDPTGFGDATPAQLHAAGVNGPRSYDGDLLDLLSDSCAARAWGLMGLSPQEGEARRADFRRRLEGAIKERDA